MVKSALGFKWVLPFYAAHRKKSFTKIVLVMKLAVMLLFISIFSVQASGVAQIVTLEGKKLTCKQVFAEIEKQTGYLVFGNKEIVESEKIVTLNIKNWALTKLLDLILINRPFKYEIRNKTIFIFKEESSKLSEDEKEMLHQHLNFIDAPITIQVADSTGKALVGATITNQRTKKSALTNDAGIAKLRANEGDVLLISFVGMESQRIAVNKTLIDKTTIAVTLKPSMSGLDEVEVSVNTGYQKISRERLTGAVVSISEKAYHQSIPVTGNILTNLEGRAAGLVYNPNTGDKNGGGLSIRGVSTLNADTKPLIILDGFPTEIDLDNINPADVETIDILKDAAAAAIYGVRSSNGVIIITTKRGKQGALSMRFTSALTTQNLPDLSFYNYLTGRDYVSAEQQRTLYNMSTNANTSKTLYDSRFISYTPVFGATDDLKNGRITQAQADAIFDQYGAYDNMHDYKDLFWQHPVMKTADLSLSGGSNNISYLFGVSHQDNKRMERGNNDNRTVLTYRGNFRFLKRFTLDAQSFYTIKNAKTAPSPAYASFRPYQRFTDEQGNPVAAYFQPTITSLSPFMGTSNSANDAKAAEALAKGLFDPRYFPYQELTASNTKLQSSTYRFQGNLSVDLIRGLKLDLGGSYEKQTDILTSLKTKDAYEIRMAMNLYSAAEPTTGLPVFQFPVGDIKGTTLRNVKSYTLRAQLNYNLNIGDHGITALLGSEQRRIETSSSLSTLFGYSDNTLLPQQTNMLLFNGQQNPTPFLNNFSANGTSFFGYNLSDFFNETYVDNRFVSSYGNAAYSFRNKYTLTGSFRIDQSNLFGTDPKFRYVPLWSAGVLWAMRKEMFMNNIDWLSKLNLRASVGYNGNTASGAGPFTTVQVQRNILAQPNPINGYVIKSPLNNSLRWEKTLNYNLGVDFSILNGRIFSSVDYYLKNSRDLIEMMNIDPTKGGNGAGIMTNNASVINKGIDISVNSINIRRRNFSWLTQVTASFNNNEITKLNYSLLPTNGFYLTSGSLTKVKGYPMQPLFAYRYAGLNQLGQPTVHLSNGKTGMITAMPGDTAATFMGTTIPKYVVGFNNQITLHHFDLNFLFMYYGGHAGYIAPPTLNTDRPINGALDYWKQAGDELHTNNPGLPLPPANPRYYNVFAQNTYTFGNIHYKRMDYLALRNVTLSYNLDHLLKKTTMTNTFIRLQVQNPAKIVFNGERIDPETMNLRSGTRSLPVLRSYTISISTDF